MSALACQDRAAYQCGAMPHPAVRIGIDRLGKSPVYTATPPHAGALLNR